MDKLTPPAKKMITPPRSIGRLLSFRSKSKKAEEATKIQAEVEEQQAQTNKSNEHNSNIISFKFRSTDMIHPRDAYKLGAIFSAPLHSQVSDMSNIHGGHNSGLSYVVQTKNNCGPVYSKFRKFICVKRFHHHVCAVPIYTHGGKGLEGKHEEQKSEFVSLREINAAKTKSPESKYDLLWAMPAKGRTMEPRETVWFTFQHTLMYTNAATYEGQLSGPSLLKLLSLIEEEMKVPQELRPGSQGRR